MFFTYNQIDFMFLFKLHFFSELIDVDIDDAKEAVFAQIISRLESVR